MRSLYKGVIYHEGAWRARIKIDKKLIHLGKGKTEAAAGLLHDLAAKKTYGSKARLNYSPENSTPVNIKDNLKGIRLKDGQISWVDNIDFHLVADGVWYLNKGPRNNNYVYRTRDQQSLSRMILGMSSDDSRFVNWINGNHLDNRRINLEDYTSSQQKMKAGKRKGMTSKFKGVSWHGNSGYWVARCGRKYLGRFQDEIKAAKAYDMCALKEFGSFARTNAELGLYK